MKRKTFSQAFKKSNIKNNIPEKEQKELDRIFSLEGLRKHIWWINIGLPKFGLISSDRKIKEYKKYLKKST